MELSSDDVRRTSDILAGFLLFCYWFKSQAFSALMLLVGRQEGYPACKKTEWWGAGVVICLERGADLHTALLMPLPLTVCCFSKIQIGLPLWYRLTRVVPEKRPLNGCVCVSDTDNGREQHRSAICMTIVVLVFFVVYKLH